MVNRELITNGLLVETPGTYDRCKFLCRRTRRRRRRRKRRTGRAIAGTGAARDDRRRAVRAGRAYTAGAQTVAEHDVAKDRARHTAQTAHVPILPHDADGRHAHDTDRRSDHTERLLATTLPGVHVQQSYRLFLQTTRRY